MATLPTNRTTSNSRDEHVNDHNELQRLHNVLDTLNIEDEPLLETEVNELKAALRSLGLMTT